MKGNEKKTKEVKKAKADDTATKHQSEYQKEKSKKSTIEPAIFKPKK